VTLKSYCLNAFVLASLLSCFFPEAASAEITVNADKVVRQKSENIGGTMIEWHDVPSPLVTNTPIDYQKDLRDSKVKIVRMGSYPDPRNKSQTLADFDKKVLSVISSNAVPLFYAPIKPGLPYLNMDAASNGTIASNIVYQVKHYRVAPFNLKKQYWEVGNEPDITIDHKVASTAEYIKDFTDVHAALSEAGLRDYVSLGGPVVSRAYHQGGIFFADRLMDDFLAECHDLVDIITWHHYGNLRLSAPKWQYFLLNDPKKVDNIHDANRMVDPNNKKWNEKNAYIGVAALLDKMKNFTFKRQAKLGLTEHNAGPIHSIQAGLWNLAVTHFMLYNATQHPGVLDNAFIFDQQGKAYDFPLYNSDLTRDYSNWALWINGNLRGSQVLAQETTQNFNEFGNPYLLVTATKDKSNLYIEVINRNIQAIQDRVDIKGMEVLSSPTLFTMADGVFPNASTSTTLKNNFNFLFPPASVSIFKFPLQDKKLAPKRP
jgi:hypothetical protein